MTCQYSKLIGSTIDDGFLEAIENAVDTTVCTSQPFAPHNQPSSPSDAPKSKRRQTLHAYVDINIFLPTATQAIAISTSHTVRHRPNGLSQSAPEDRFAHELSFTLLPHFRRQVWQWMHYLSFICVPLILCPRSPVLARIEIRIPATRLLWISV
jgi:hypothetical protein